MTGRCSMIGFMAMIGLWASVAESASAPSLAVAYRLVDDVDQCMEFPVRLDLGEREVLERRIDAQHKPCRADGRRLAARRRNVEASSAYRLIDCRISIAPGFEMGAARTESTESINNRQ